MLRVGTRGGDKWKDALAKVTKGIHTNVGILEGGSGSGGVSLALIGSVHEFGGKHMPQRSFLRATLEAKGNEWCQVVRQMLQQRLDAMRAFTMLGEVASKDVQERIKWGIDPALESETIRRKLKRGKQEPDTPLIDTGALMEAVSYEVKDGRA